jgi:hypothetical protein
MIKDSMKKLFLLSMCLLGLYGTLFPQAPTESPIASPTAATATTAPTAATAATSLATSLSTPTPVPSATSSSASSDIADRIHRKLEKKLGHKHGIIIDTDDDKDGAGASKDIPSEVIPLVGIVFLSIFGAPVLIVILIGFFALLVSRSRQRTIRMLVEKGQPVPAELLAPATRAGRQRSDVRRGVVWTMIGVGLIVWLGAVNDWEGGAWSFGLIPFLIGLGYLIIWKLENKKDIPPPPPAP